MKQIFKPNISNGDLYRDDQEGSSRTTMSGNGDTMIQTSGFHRFLHAKYLNPAQAVPLYILAQILGSIMAALMGEFIYGIKSDVLTTRPGQGCQAAFLAELIADFIVVFVIAAVTQQARSVGPLSGLVIGMSIALAVLITGPISGGSLNPARSLGPAIVSRNFDRIWIYLTAPVIGALLGALMYRVLRLRPIS
ncbi:hypothetical protein ES319_A09G060000v1 [Gossypium barbadense]|uniref:Aquaporin n=1 Tax=Gossypium barbadense TaxID=3634 RepID=A0A5J5UE92_GOSBA|nr:hypothetical protein ES319_A09G060000v1 [Gossypium barbadense]